MKLGVYCRVSTDMQQDKNESIPDQKRLGKEFAESMGWDYQYYADAQTGKNPAREAFTQLRNDVKSGRIQAIWVKNHSRLARRTSTALSLIEDLAEMHLAGNHIPIYILSSEYNYEDHTDKMLFTLLSGLSESEGSQIVERTKRGRDHKFRNGGLHVRRLYGYYRSYNNETGKTEYHVNVKEAEIVKEIINRVIQGESYNQIAQNLTNRYILTPEGNRKWRPTTVARIADQRLYTGYYDYKGTQNIKSYLYEPIIDKQTHLQAVEATSKAIDRKKGMDGKRRHNHHMVTSLFHCTYCGGSIYFHSDRKTIKGKHYHYANYEIKHTSKCKRIKKVQSMPKEDMDAWVRAETVKFLLDRDTIWELLKQKREEFGQRTQIHNKEAQEIEKRIMKIQKQKKKLIDIKVTLDDTEDEDLDNKIRDLILQQRDLEKEMKEIQNEL